MYISCVHGLRPSAVLLFIYFLFTYNIYSQLFSYSISSLFDVSHTIEECHQLSFLFFSLFQLVFLLFFLEILFLLNDNTCRVFFLFFVFFFFFYLYVSSFLV
jgi:hypothetical protein